MMRQRNNGVQVRLAARAVALLAVVGTMLALGACRARPRPDAAGNQIGTGDVLSGRLAPQYPEQAFHFEGVESSLLDFTLQSDEMNRSAPAPTLIDPEGKPVVLDGHRTTPEGAATTRYEGVILKRTGNYRLELASTDKTSDSWYLFQHRLRFPSIVDDRAMLNATEATPVSFTAPYGATVSVRIAPVNRSNLAPDIRGVKDPSGGRALDPTATPQGVNPPQMAPTTDGGVLLMFVAPRAGRYTVLAAAKPGREGEASINVDVQSPSFDRSIWHTGADPSAPMPGMPAAPATAATSSPGQVHPAQMPPAPPPPAPALVEAPPAGGFPAPAPAPEWSAPAPVTSPVANR
jgi:hypothetical protein